MHAIDTETRAFVNVSEPCLFSDSHAITAVMWQMVDSFLEQSVHLPRAPPLDITTPVPSWHEIAMAQMERFSKTISCGNSRASDGYWAVKHDMIAIRFAYQLITHRRITIHAAFAEMMRTIELTHMELLLGVTYDVSMHTICQRLEDMFGRFGRAHFLRHRLHIEFAHDVIKKFESCRDWNNFDFDFHTSLLDIAVTLKSLSTTVV